MTSPRQPVATLFSQVDVSTGSRPHVVSLPREEHSELLREMLAAQDRTNELLEDLTRVMAAHHKQRAS
jgi:hypothetical protein